MKVCAILLVAVLTVGVARAGFFAHPLPLLRTPRVYNIIVRSDGSLLPSAAYSLPLDHPIFHTAPGAATSPAKATPAKEGDSEQAPAAEKGSDAPTASSPASPQLPPALPITHVAVNFPGTTNSTSEPTVVATTLPFYSLYHPLAFPIPDPTPFIHPFGPHPGYFFAPAFHPPTIPGPPGPAGDAKAAATPAKESDGGEKAEEKKEESER
ncbi:uncharacterized protein [Hetaerina americana]|uniref:uncharacterized protein n=1 Tax=Hetaerina americana TaxID=62018 RepID=UPI003A7F5A52